MITENCDGCPYYKYYKDYAEICLRLKDKPRTKGEYELSPWCWISRKGWDCFVRIEDVTVCSLSVKPVLKTTILDW